MCFIQLLPLPNSQIKHCLLMVLNGFRVEFGIDIN